MPTVFTRASVVMAIHRNSTRPLDRKELCNMGDLVSAGYKAEGYAIKPEKVLSKEPDWEGMVFNYPESFTSKMDEIIKGYFERPVEAAAPKTEPPKRKRIPIASKPKPAYSAKIKK